MNHEGEHKNEQVVVTKSRKASWLPHNSLMENYDESQKLNIQLYRLVISKYSKGLQGIKTVKVFDLSILHESLRF